MCVQEPGYQGERKKGSILGAFCEHSVWIFRLQQDAAPHPEMLTSVIRTAQFILRQVTNIWLLPNCHLGIVTFLDGSRS